MCYIIYVVEEVDIINILIPLKKSLIYTFFKINNQIFN
jgi:hypothetical protein